MTINNNKTDDVISNDLQSGKVYVSKLPYVFCTLFFGVLGSHEFYAGRKKKGFKILGIFIAIMIFMIGGASLFRFNQEAFGFLSSIPAICLVLLVVFIAWLEFTGIKALFKKSNENGKILV